ncbi:MAG: SH3 domain-containing protein [Candidatus Omnitrophota bacterium]
MRRTFPTILIVLSMVAGSMPAEKRACAAEETRTPPYVAQVIVDSVNVRAGQNRNFDRLGQLSLGDRVVVLGTSYSWQEIRLPEDFSVFVYGELVEYLRDGIGRISGSRVNIRSRPDGRSAVVGQLSEGTLVRVKDRGDDGWYEIAPVEGVTGWIKDDFLAYADDTIPPVRVVELPTRNVYVLQHQEEERLRAEEERRRAERQARERSLTAVVYSLGEDAVSPQVRHWVKDEDGQTYLLKGYRNVLDGYLNQKVHIKGLAEEDDGAAYPVVLVTRIKLVL